MKIGYAMCGSFCTHKKSLEILRKLKDNGYDILPILSEITSVSDTRFGTAKELISAVEDVCENKAIKTIIAAEPLGPREILDALVICPCTGNTLAKLALGITDTTVTMAAKAHLRSDRPLVIALATNDALSGNLKNIATLYSRKNVYFVPLLQDDPVAKPHSLVADFDLVPDALLAALSGNGHQMRKLFN
jgi:dipicolinate synthase subunit B